MTHSCLHILLLHGPKMVDCAIAGAAYWQPVRGLKVIL